MLTGALDDLLRQPRDLGHVDGEALLTEAFDDFVEENELFFVCEFDDFGVHLHPPESVRPLAHFLEHELIVGGEKASRVDVCS